MGKSRMRQVVAIAAALAMLATACGGSGADALEIGVKRIALDLAFKNEALAEPVPPARIIEVIGAPEEIFEEDEEPNVVRRVQSPLPPPRETCPEADPESFPKEPVTVFFRGAPKEGTYRLHNQGTIRVTGGAFPFTLPFPAVSTWQIRNVVVTPAVPSDIPQPVRDYLGSGDIVTFDLEKKVTTVGASLIVTDSYRYNRTELTLQKRVTSTQGRKDTFTPTPAVTLIKTEQGDGDTWNSAGFDRATNTSMVVQGKIERRQFVDVCGERFDAWKVVSTESTANLLTGEHSETDVQQPNVYRFANHFGALVLQEEGHYSQSLIIDGRPVTLRYDYISTLDSIEPVGP